MDEGKGRQSATAKRRQRLPFWQQTPISLRRVLPSARSLVRVKFPSPTTYYHIVAVPFPPPTDKQTASLLDMDGLAVISLSSRQAVFDARIDQTSSSMSSATACSCAQLITGDLTGMNA